MIARLTIGLATLGLSLPAAALPELRDFEAQLVGSQLHFTGRLIGGESVAAVELRYRAADLSGQSTPMARDHDRLLAVIDAGPLLLGGDSVRLLYSVIARDAAGEIVARLASDDAPVSVIITRVFAASELDQPDDPLVTAPVPEATERSSLDQGLTNTWWLWTAAAVVLLGAGIAAGVVLTN